MRTTAMIGSLTLLACFTTGCVIDTVERDGLPRGATLLDSDVASCDGVVEIEGNPDVAVGDGQSKTIALRRQHDMDWECLSDARLHRGGDLRCPRGTDYVRITRNVAEDDFRIECFAG